MQPVLIEEMTLTIVASAVVCLLSSLEDGPGFGDSASRKEPICRRRADPSDCRRGQYGSGSHRRRHELLGRFGDVDCRPATVAIAGI